MSVGEFGEQLSDPCQVDVERQEETIYVRVSGALDVDCGRILDTTLAAFPDEGATAIIVDLRALEFVDSAGLRVLLEHELRSQKKGFGFSLIAPQGHPKKVFDMTNIGQVIDVLPDPDAPTSEAAKAAVPAQAIHPRPKGATWFPYVLDSNRSWPSSNRPSKKRCSKAWALPSRRWRC